MRDFVLEADKAVLTHATELRIDPYPPDQTTRLKIRNKGYSQWIGREKLFERERAGDPGWRLWNACALVADQQFKGLLARPRLPYT